MTTTTTQYVYLSEGDTFTYEESVWLFDRDNLCNINDPNGFHIWFSGRQFHYGFMGNHNTHTLPKEFDVYTTVSTLIDEIHRTHPQRHRNDVRRQQNKAKQERRQNSRPVDDDE